MTHICPTSTGGSPISRQPRRHPTIRALAKALPLASSARLGKQVFFDTRVAVSRETDARQVVEPGTVAFWTDGDALALLYGPTPIPGDECRLAVPRNVLGRVDGDPRLLATVQDDDPIRVEIAEIT
ncbi:cyclophilin-like family protein [Streptomyces chromofuscus]|uniref:Cyclophilin TM1367-like domain-containing protein n=1 Tax=Streptomyces chromofuscus TaxID=42881 RepID=A0A7M2T0F9_STRCW|nr:cyclophilin-like family protein [Streptomyces chromofuscus]QOV41824.1 hypothetical protein IPT68_18130 [Streptomyces chromofuscus]GGS88078.1 hypothetical protein GCM10010254_04940 [Streptomyces chromofuscus]